VGRILRWRCRDGDADKSEGNSWTILTGVTANVHAEYVIHDAAEDDPQRRPSRLRGRAGADPHHALVHHESLQP